MEDDHSQGLPFMPEETNCGTAALHLPALPQHVDEIFKSQTTLQSEVVQISGLSVHWLRKAGPEQTANSPWLLLLGTVLTPTSNLHSGNRTGNIHPALPPHHPVCLGE